MASESIITATFGVPGSGKTYSRVKWLVDDFLLNNSTGLYITNIPLLPEKIADYFCDLHKNYTRESILSRLIIIPDEELVTWEKLNQLENRDLNTFTSETFPPTQYLQKFDLQNSHIAIDEFHKYFSKRGPKLLKKLWNDWFAEIRKTGCVFEAITQSYGQMADEFLDKCGSRLELVNHADFRDPFFGIRLGDWYELRAGIFGRVVVQRVSERETMQRTSTSGRLCWVSTGKSRTFVLEPEYFSLYKSFHNYTGISGERKSPAEIYGKKIFIWFFRRNWVNILPRIFLACFVIWFLFFGGFGFCIDTVFSTFKRSGSSNRIVKSGSQSVNKTSSVKSGSQTGNKISSVKSGLQTGNKNSSVVKSGSMSTGNKNSSVQHSEDIEKKPFSDSLISLYKPAFFFNNLVVLRNSYEVTVGYKFIDKGPYHGKKIIKINSKNRSYILDDGLSVSMF